MARGKESTSTVKRGRAPTLQGRMACYGGRRKEVAGERTPPKQQCRTVVSIRAPHHQNHCRGCGRAQAHAV